MHYSLVVFDEDSSDECDVKFKVIAGTKSKSSSETIAQVNT